jgi:hypothetical protein
MNEGICPLCGCECSDEGCYGCSVFRYQFEDFDFETGQQIV